MFLSFLLLSTLVFTPRADAYIASFTVSTYTGYDGGVYPGFAYGYNITQGFGCALQITEIRDGRVYVYLPDDGSTWNVVGYINVVSDFSTLYASNFAGSQSRQFAGTVTTPGSFSGYSPKTATDAANTAKTEAINAKNAAVDAKNAANTASTNATNALYILNGTSNGGKSLAATYDKANSANSNASTAAARVWDASESKSAAQLAKEARDKANANYEELQNLKTSITNIENNLAAGDTMPPTILSIKGYNGATCTTGSTFSATVQAFDNSGVLEFRVKADTGTWSDWVPISSYNTAGGVTGTGAHTLTVEVRDSTGNVSTGNMTFFKL
jgi:hypothetical protein